VTCETPFVPTHFQELKEDLVKSIGSENNDSDREVPHITFI